MANPCAYPDGGIGEAPLDGKQYGRQNADWTEILRRTPFVSQWDWIDTTTGDPGLGNVGSNANLLANATEIRISSTDRDGNPILDIQMQPGDVLMVLDESRVAYERYSIANATDNTTWKELQVIPTGNGRGNPAAGNLMDVAWIPTS